MPSRKSGSGLYWGLYWVCIGDRRINTGVGERARMHMVGQIEPVAHSRPSRRWSRHVMSAAKVIALIGLGHPDQMKVEETAGSRSGRS
jgi:hypothetical protein